MEGVWMLGLTVEAGEASVLWGSKKLEIFNLNNEVLFFNLKTYDY
jgi:hypothetical protein